MYPFEDDFNSYRRKRNIFSSPDVTPSFGGNLFEGIPPAAPINNNTASPNSLENNDFTSLYKQITSQPEGKAQARYRGFLESDLPTKDKFKPGVTDRIAAILSGLSTGISKGAGEGYQTARGILDRPYEEATARYKLQGGRLGEAARIEQENELNRVKLVRDMLESSDRQRESERKSRETTGRIANWESTAKTRAETAARTGFHFNVNASTGNMEAFRPNPQALGGLDKLDFGKAGQSSGERILERGQRVGAEEKARQPFAIGRIKATGEEARKTEEARQTGRIALRDWEAKNPTFVLTADDQGNVYGVNRRDPTDIRVTGIDKVSPEEAIQLRTKAQKELIEERKKASIEVKKTPGVTPAVTPTTTTRTREITPEGKEVTTTTRAATESNTIQMKHPTTGKVGPVAKKDVEAAKKAGYTIVEEKK